MLTKTKIALCSALVMAFASAAMAQQAPLDTRDPRIDVEPAPYVEYRELGVGVVIEPNYDSRFGNVIRERDIFTGYSPRSYSDTPGND